jgi:hypothetical protein
MPVVWSSLLPGPGDATTWAQLRARSKSPVARTRHPTAHGPRSVQGRHYWEVELTTLPTADDVSMRFGGGPGRASFSAPSDLAKSTTRQ